MTAPATAPRVAPVLTRNPPPGRIAPPIVGAEHPNGWLALALSIALLAFLSSATGLANGFAYDDRWIIVENDRTHSLHNSWRLFNETYWPNIRGAALYRPVPDLEEVPEVPASHAALRGGMARMRGFGIGPT